MKYVPSDKINTNSPIYYAIHYWLIANYGIATKCENKNCNYKNPKRFEWAKKQDKKYDYNRKNFIQLCCSCHRKYDLTDMIKENMRQSNRYALQTKCKKGHLYTKENTRVTKFKRKDSLFINLWRNCRICDALKVKKWRLGAEYIPSTRTYRAIPKKN